VALKIVRSGDPELARRLAQEARALERLAAPGLIGLLDAGFDGDQAFLVMELVEGETLAQRLRAGPLSPAATAALGERLGDALGYVHERGIVHRDLKPSNILLGADDEAWLSDFGIAQLHDATTMTVEGSTMGTVSYMAPEQLDDHQVGPAADIWSLGIVLLECLTGRRVFEGSPSEIVARRVARPLVVPGDLPAPWRLVLRGMLDSDPALRPSGPEVALLLRAPAFDVAWEPVDPEATAVTASGASEETVLMPGVVPGAPVDADQTRVSGAAPSSLSSPGDRVGGTGVFSSVGPWRVSARSRRWWAAAIVALAVVLAVVLVSAGPRDSTATTTTTVASHTAGGAATTTTVASPGATALAQLVHDAAAGQAAGTITPSSALAITNAAGAALTDQGLASTVQAQSDLQSAASDVTAGVQSGVIALGEGAALLRDLMALATSLGLAAPSTAPTPTPTPVAPGGPGHGKGRGQGNQP
ncbi:MAG: serine/threonine-protein kinase, partial [Acidimicrobiales bacterium]